MLFFFIPCIICLLFLTCVSIVVACFLFPVFLPFLCYCLVIFSPVFFPPVFIPPSLFFLSFSSQSLFLSYNLLFLNLLFFHPLVFFFYLLTNPFLLLLLFPSSISSSIYFHLLFLSLHNLLHWPCNLPFLHPPVSVPCVISPLLN